MNCLLHFDKFIYIFIYLFIYRLYARTSVCSMSLPSVCETC